MDVYIVLEVVVSPCHLASLGQFYVYRYTDLALDCVVKIFTLPGIHQQVFCPFPLGNPVFRCNVRISPLGAQPITLLHLIDESVIIPTTENHALQFSE